MEAGGREGFLAGVTLRPVRLSGSGSLQVVGLALGNGAPALEVLVVSSPREPALPTLRSAWKERSDGRAAPLLLVVLYADKAALCGRSPMTLPTSLLGIP